MFALLVLACALPSPSQATSEVSNAAAFRIGGELVPVDDYGRWLLEVLGEREAQAFALDWLVLREARELGVEVSEGEVVRAIDAEVKTRIDNAFLGQREGWLAELERTGRSEGEYRRARSLELHPWLTASAIAAIDRVVPENKIEREWKLRYGYRGRRFDVRMMRFRVMMEMPPEGTPTQERNADRERRKLARLGEALAVRSRVLAGEDFGRLASQYSDEEETRANAGRFVGGFVHAGWPGAFLDAMDALEVGDVSEPHYARGGWWLIEVLGIDETPLEEVRRELVARLIEKGPESDEIAVVQQRLLEGTEVEVLPATYERNEQGEWPGAYEVALMVDGEPVQRGQYALWMLHSRGGIWARRFIADWLIQRAAREAGITVTDRDVAERTRAMLQFRIDNAHRGSREAFEAYVAATGMSEESMLRSFAWRARPDLLAERLILRDRTVTAEEVSGRWVDVYGEGGVGQMVRSMAIGIQTPALAPGLSPDELNEELERAAREARLRADEIVARIEDGEDFATLAERYGEAATPGGIGAEPRRFQPETWQPELAEFVRSLAPGDVGEPQRFGPYWLVFECVALRKVALEDVYAELEQELMTRTPYGIEVATFRNVLYEAASPEILPAMYE